MFYLVRQLEGDHFSYGLLIVDWQITTYHVNDSQFNAADTGRT